MVMHIQAKVHGLSIMLIRMHAITPSPRARPPAAFFAQYGTTAGGITLAASSADDSGCDPISAVHKLTLTRSLMVWACHFVLLKAEES